MKGAVLNGPVREATADDVSALVEVINLAYRVEDDFAIGDRTSPDSVAAMIREPNSNFLVAPASGDNPVRLAGAVYVQARDDRGFFGPLAVDPAHQGRGLGKALVSAAEAYCRARGCQHMDLDVLSLRPELIPFYQSLGYVISRTAEYPRPQDFRQPCHVISMTRPL
ncbi:MAG TPA: GNAT family N-acetyltransferase [Longimicrobiales bacterium]|nr:GNAT family N-acetyltransferase [Longimicrobiales bacterium]